LVFQQLFRSLPLLLLAAVFVMYVILGILYESYVHPFTVLFPAIVPAVVGGLATLYLFHSVLSLYSVIGLFLLLGIVKKKESWWLILPCNELTKAGTCARRFTKPAWNGF